MKDPNIPQTTAQHLRVWATVRPAISTNQALILARAATELDILKEALDEIIKEGTSPTSRDNGPNYVANRMYHLADKARSRVSP